MTSLGLAGASAGPVERRDDIEVARWELRPRRWPKRTFDIVVGTALLLVALPIIVCTAIGSAVALRAWPFFVQDRVGRDGRTFRFVKIRTLPSGTNAYADKYALSEIRIPAFTRILRCMHLDELPQLALVVVGKMSLVGPRPEMPWLHARLPRHFATSRSLVRPGCTGLWQIGVHCNGLISEAPEYDTVYVRHHDTRLDLWIMLQTAIKMLRCGQPRITLADLPGWVRTAPVVAEPVQLELPLERVVIDLTSLTAPALLDIDA